MVSSSFEGVEDIVAATEKLSNEEPLALVLTGQANLNNSHDSSNRNHVSAGESFSKDYLESEANVSLLDLCQAMKANKEKTLRMKALITEKKLYNGCNQKLAPQNHQKSSFTPIAPKPSIGIPDTPPRKRKRGSCICAHCGLAKKDHICPSQCVDKWVQTVQEEFVSIQDGDIVRAVSDSCERTP